MRSPSAATLTWSLTTAILAVGGLSASAEGERVTYEEHVLPILENRCFSCHNPDRRRGGLDLSTYANTLEGGSGGAVAMAGEPGTSRLLTTVSHDEEPIMPPEGGKIPDAEIETIRKWIEGGLLETATSVARRPSRPQVDLSMSAPSGRPEGPPPMPAHVLLEPVVITPRGDSITAMAASPWAPLVAVGGQHQVLLYDTQRSRLAAVLPYPEGFVESLRFSSSGTVLIAGAGRPGRMGHAVAWDVKTGERLMEIGREFDSAMSADISADQRLVALGSTSRSVRVFRTSDGEMDYEIDNHTEWVVSVAFSPDGILLASGDRNGNVFVHEATGGAQFHMIGNVHEGGVTDLAWRADSNVLASAGADGRVRLWAMQNGREIRGFEAHPGGVTAVAFSHEGELVSGGRDHKVKIWKADGNLRLEVAELPDLVTSVRFLEDSKHVVIGDFLGQVQQWETSGEAAVKVADLSSHPVSIEERRKQQLAAVEQWQAEEQQRAQAFAAVRAEVDGIRAQLATAEAQVAGNTALVGELTAMVASLTSGREAAVAERDQLNERLAAVTRMTGEFEEKRAELGGMDAELAAQDQRRQRLREQIEQARAVAGENEQADEEEQGEQGEQGEEAPEPVDQPEPEQTGGEGEAAAAIEQMERELAALDASVNELRQRREQLAGSLTEPEPMEPIRQGIERLNASLAEMEQQMAETTGRLEASTRQRDEAMRQAEEFKEKVAVVEAQMQEREGALAQARERLQAHQGEARWLEAAAFNVGLIQDRNQLRDQEGILEVMGEEAAELESGIAAANAEIKRFETERDEVLPRLVAESEQAAERTRAQQGKLASVEEKKREIEQLAQQMARQRETERAELERLRTELTALAGLAGGEEEGAAKEALDAVRARIAAAEEAIAASERSMAGINPQAELEVIRQAEQERLAILMTEQQQRGAAVEEKRAELAQLEQKLPDLRATIERKQTELATARAERAKLEAEVAELRQQVDNREQQYLSMLPEDAR